MTRRGKSSGRGRSGDPRKQAPRQPNLGRRTPADPGPDLVGGIAEALADPHPLAMLTLASSLAAALDPMIETEEIAGPTVLPSAVDLVSMLADGGQPQTAALAWVLAHLALDDLARARVLRSLDRTQLPPWMPQLVHTDVYGAWQTMDTLRDGSNICFGVRIGDFDLTVVVYLDFNNEGAVKDAFVAPQSLTEFQQTWQRLAPPVGVEAHELALADARAQVEEGLWTGQGFWPPFESDTWPQLRPFLEFVLQRCPPDGESMESPRWDGRQATEAVTQFFASPEGRPLMRDRDLPALLGAWMNFALTTGYGDPMLISGSKIEIFLLDWVADQVDANGVEKLPGLLEAFVPYGHAQRGIGPGETALTLQTLATVTPAYLLQLDASVAVQPWGSADPHRLVRDMYAEEVGGSAELHGLDDRPLPAEELDLDGVADDLHHRLRVIDTIATDKCRLLGDPEVITAVRRLTHDIAVADPDVFRRRAKDLNTAAALCWLVARANDQIGPNAALRTDQFLAQFGVKSVSTRAGTLRAAVGGRSRYNMSALGSARYLTGGYRRVLIDTSRAHLAEVWDRGRDDPTSRW